MLTMLYMKLMELGDFHMLVKTKTQTHLVNPLNSKFHTPLLAECNPPATKLPARIPIPPLNGRKNSRFFGCHRANTQTPEPASTTEERCTRIVCQVSNLIPQLTTYTHLDTIVPAREYLGTLPLDDASMADSVRE